VESRTFLFFVQREQDKVLTSNFSYTGSYGFVKT